MVKIKYWLTGYREIIPKISFADAVAVLIRHKIPFEAIRCEKIIISESVYKRYTSDFKAEEYTVSDALGLWGIRRKIKHKIAFFSSVFLGIILVFLSGRLVWDIKISGNENIPSALVLEELSECGFSVGSIWRDTNLSKIEYEMLGKCEEISWININKIGTTALVRIIERSDKPEVIMPSTGYANIVADRDCVIEEITVSAGTPAVKIGDTVKKGDILILGVENNERGRLIRADGYVVGRVEEEISTSLMRDREVKTRLSEETVSVNIKIFNFSLNIFKKYGNSDKECDIIEGKRRVVLFGKYRLPVTIVVKTRVNYGEKIESYTYSELARVCSTRHRQLVKQRLLDKDLTKIRTESAFIGDSYTITSYVIYSARVGALSEVLVE